LKKNLRILLRNPLTLLILLFGPMLVVIIVSLAFNNTAGYEIQVGVYSETYPELSEQFIESLDNTFTTIKHPSEETCIDAIKSTGAHSCIIIPANMKIEAGVTNTLKLYVDESRVNIVSAIKQGILQSIQETSANISQSLTGGILDALSFTEDQIIKDNIVLKERISETSIAINNIGDTQELVTSSNLEFNQDDFEIDVLEKNTRDLDKAFTKAKDFAEDAVDEYRNTLEEIEEVNESSVKTYVDQGLDTVTDLENDIGNLTLDGDAISALNSVVEELTLQVQILDANLKSARSNRDIATSKITGIEESLAETKSKLELVSESFGSILSLIGSNTVRDADNIVRPVEIKEISVISGSQLQFLYPSLLLLVLMFVTIIAASTQVIGEKLDKSTLRMSMTPVGFMSRAVATFFTIFILTSVQLLITLIATQLVFDIDILTHIGSISAVLITAIIFFIILGMAIGYIFNSQHSGMFGAIAISSVFFVVSDLILPLESLSVELLQIIQYTPFVLATNLLRKVMFFETPLLDLQIPFLVLLGTSIGVLILAILIATIENKGRKIKAKYRARKA
jgi:ABC-type multidrug transport system permease subunit